MTSGTGTCSVTATKAADSNYASTTSAASTVSAALTPVLNGTPVITSLSEYLTKAGSAAFTLTVTGSNFVNGAVVQWNGSAQNTTFVTTTQLTAVITAADLASAGTVNVVVVNPAPGGGSSNALEFAIDGVESGTGVSLMAVSSSQSTTLSVQQSGQSISFPVTITGVTAATSTVTVSCLNLPMGAACSYDSNTQMVTITTTAGVTPVGSYEVLLVFTVTQLQTAQLRRRMLFAAGLLGLPLGMLWMGGRKRAIRWVIISLFALALALSLTGCGGVSGFNSGNTMKTQASMVVTLNVLH
jgi:hypothetical protein